MTLPKDVPRPKVTREGYTGGKGAKGKHYKSKILPNGDVFFKATQPLKIAEGLTIVVSWPKGFVKEPTAGQRAGRFFRDNALVTVVGIGLVIVFGYFLIAWHRVGRDPEKGIIIPLFEPPEDMSPAGVRYVRRMGFDQQCFSAAVISAAVSGHITIEQDDGDFTLSKTEDSDAAVLSADEKAVTKKLLGSRKSIKLEKKHHSRFQKALKEMKKVLSAAYEKRLFHTNLRYFIPGLVLSALTIVVAGLFESLFGRADLAMGAVFICVWLSLWSLGVFALVTAVASVWRAVRHGSKGVGSAIGITLFATPFFVGELFGLGLLVVLTSLLMLPILAGFVTLNLLFYHLLKAPTGPGREVMDRIDGFRMYLSTAEQDMLETAHPPEKTPELFERYLPYALALDVSNAWAERFSEVLAAAGTGTEGGYSPVWYHGVGAWTGGGGVDMASSLSGSFSSALSAASTAPGSSSGGGGGGSSGGGGGGGGGGGW